MSEPETAEKFCDRAQYLDCVIVPDMTGFIELIEKRDRAQQARGVERVIGILDVVLAAHEADLATEKEPLRRMCVDLQCEDTRALLHTLRILAAQIRGEPHGALPPA